MKRRQNGLHLIELSVGMMVLIPIVLYGIDIACIYFAGSYNSSLCRDACRAAAAGPPTIYCTSNPMLAPNARAKRVIAGRFDPHSIIRVSATPVLTETIRDPKPIAPWGGPVQGEVTVQTEVTVNPPFNLPAIAPAVLLTLPRLACVFLSLQERESALYMALRCQEWDVVRVLLKRKADTTLKTKCKEIALHIALDENAPFDVIKQILLLSGRSAIDAKVICTIQAIFRM